MHLEQCKECKVSAKTVDYSYLKAQEAEKKKAETEAKAAAEKAKRETEEPSKKNKLYKDLYFGRVSP